MPPVAGRDYSAGSPPRSIREIKFINNVVADSLSIIFNALMLYVINTQATHQLKQYRKVLLLNTTVDLIYSVITILFQPTTFVNEGYFFLIMEGLLRYLPQPFTTLCIVTHLFMLYFTLTIVPVQFVYRYLLLCRNIELNIPQFFVLISVSLLVAGGYASMWIVNFWPEDDDFKIFGVYLDNDKWWQANGEVPPFAVAFYDDMNYVGNIAACIYLIVYLIIIACSLCIMVTLHKIRHSMSTKTRELQQQISRVLFVQAFVPFVTIVVPLIFDYITIHFHVYMPDSGTIFMVASAWSPVVNPIVTLIVIGQYRQAVMQYLRLWTPLYSSPTSSSQSQVNTQLTAISA